MQMSQMTVFILSIQTGNYHLWASACRLTHLRWLSMQKKQDKQGVALTGRNTTGPPCSVDRPTAHAPGRRRADRSRARPPAALQTTTDASQQNNTGPLGGPVIMWLQIISLRLNWSEYTSNIQTVL